MQSKLFRFEILRALHPTSFAARDLRTSAPVTVLEWTPPAAEREAARRQFEALTADLPGEAFSADASLYVALREAEVSRALDLLRQHGLFTGTPVATPAPAPPPPLAAPFVAEPPLAAPFREVVPKMTAPAAEPPRPLRSGRTRPPISRGGLAFCLFLLAGVAFAVGWSLGRAGAAPASPATTGTATMQNPTGNGAELLAERKARATLEASAAGLHVLRLRNPCGSPVRAAVVYTGFSGERLAEGWITLRPGQTAVVAASPSRDFHVFAASPDGSRAWGTESGLPIETEPGNFNYRLDAPADGTEKVPHGTFPVRVNNASDVSSLDCRASAGTP